MKTRLHPSTFLDAKVSVFKNVKSKKPYKTTTFREWLFNNSKDLRDEIDKIRDEFNKEKRKALKESMECITASGVFENGRSDRDLKTHNGYLVIDIDHQDNLHFGSKFFTLIDDVFSELSVVNYVGRSIGGKGYFLIIGIRYPELLRKYDEPIKVERKPIKYDSNSADEIENLVRKIESSGVSIGSSYKEYFRVGIIFHTECGESGREYYHRVCRLDPKYNSKDCDDDFDTIIKYGYNEVKLATLVQKMQEYGII